LRTVAVVGTSLAGLRSARELRGQGFDGRLVMIGAEPPYDRPPLSKKFLLGKASADDLASPGKTTSTRWPLNGTSASAPKGSAAKA